MQRAELQRGGLPHTHTLPYSLAQPSPAGPLAHPLRRAKHQSRGAVYEQILKKNEQAYALLACCTALCPSTARLLDEAVANALREK